MPQPIIRERHSCRLCDRAVKPVFALTPTPIANAYAAAPDADAVRYPLELTQCTACGHVQTRHVIKGLFEDYKYVTPQTVANYLTPFVQELRLRYPAARNVLEIGSNNGTYLKVLREAGFEATGIDPAATGEGNIKDYFTKDWAQQHNVRYDLIVANNVLAHIDDLQDVFRGITTLLAEDGALVFEVQSFADLVSAGAYDMIYAEHMSYHTPRPLAKFLRRMGLVMTRLDHIPMHGGSLRVTAKRTGREYLYYEAPIDWAAFTDKVGEMRRRVRAHVEGRKLVLLGAAAKVTTMIHHCAIADSIMFACDDTPQKQWRYIPGTNIQIRPTSELGNHAALLGAWNFEREFRQQYPNNELINPYSVAA
jgi:SAM-dependent methyltransferase